MLRTAPDSSDLDDEEEPDRMLANCFRVPAPLLETDESPKADQLPSTTVPGSQVYLRIPDENEMDHLGLRHAMGDGYPMAFERTRSW